MKILIFSDLHGSMRGIKALKRAVHFEQPDLIYCLGDILYGAGDQDASGAAEGLKQLGVPILAVRGNCDYPEDATELGFQLPLARSIERGNHEIHLCHRPLNIAFPAGDFVFTGHTHYKTLYKDDGVIYMNPGSIAVPRDGVASYATMDDHCIRLCSANELREIERLEI